MQKHNCGVILSKPCFICCLFVFFYSYFTEKHVPVVVSEWLLKMLFFKKLCFLLHYLHLPYHCEPLLNGLTLDFRENMKAKVEQVQFNMQLAF